MVGGGGGGGGGVRVRGVAVRLDVKEELKFYCGGGVGEGSVWGGQGGCERRIEVFVKIQKKKKIGEGGSGWGGGQGGCE